MKVDFRYALRLNVSIKKNLLLIFLCLKKFYDILFFISIACPGLFPCGFREFFSQQLSCRAHASS